MIDLIYYDNFAKEYCSAEKAESDIIAPPEKYLPVLRGADFYTETYRNSSGETIGIAYTVTHMKHGLVKAYRNIVAEQYGFDLKNAKVIRWTIPEVEFVKILKELGKER